MRTWSQFYHAVHCARQTGLINHWDDLILTGSNYMTLREAKTIFINKTANKWFH